MNNFEAVDPAEMARLRREVEAMRAHLASEPVTWIADWAYEHMVSGHASPAPAMLWPDPRDKTGLVPLYAAPLGAGADEARLRRETQQLRGALAGLLDAHARNLFGGGGHWERARNVLDGTAWEAQ